MSQVIKSECGKKLIIEQDARFGGGPREWDNLGTVVLGGSMKHLGDSHTFRPEREYDSRQDFIEEGALDVIKHIKRETGKTVDVILPINKYEHSGMSLSTQSGYPYNCRWDSATVGFILATKEDIRENWGIKRVTQKYRDMTEKILIAEVETLSQFVSGDVYCFRVEDEDGDVLDSCGGFYGSDFEENGLFEHVGEFPTELLKQENLEDEDVYA